MGYKEFYGKIKIYFNNGGLLSLENNTHAKGKFEIFLDKNEYLINDYNEKIYINKNKIYKSNSVSISKIMKFEINKIFKNKKSKLPLFQDIYENHYLYTKYLLNNYNKINKTKLKSLPIT